MVDRVTNRSTDLVICSCEKNMYTNILTRLFLRKLLSTEMPCFMHVISCLVLYTFFGFSENSVVTT